MKQITILKNVSTNRYKESINIVFLTYFEKIAYIFLILQKNK